MRVTLHQYQKLWVRISVESRTSLKNFVCVTSLPVYLLIFPGFFCIQSQKWEPNLSLERYLLASEYQSTHVHQPPHGSQNPTNQVGWHGTSLDSTQWWLWSSVESPVETLLPQQVSPTWIPDRWLFLSEWNLQILSQDENLTPTTRHWKCQNFRKFKDSSCEPSGRFFLKLCKKIVSEHSD